MDVPRRVGLYHVVGRRGTGKTALARKLTEWHSEPDVYGPDYVKIPSVKLGRSLVFDNLADDQRTARVLNHIAHRASKFAPVVETSCAAMHKISMMPDALFLLKEPFQSMRDMAYKTYASFFEGFDMTEFDKAWEAVELGAPIMITAPKRTTCANMQNAARTKKKLNAQVSNIPV